MFTMRFKIISKDGCMNTAAAHYGSIPSVLFEGVPSIGMVNRGSSCFRDFLRFVAMCRCLSIAEEYEKLSDIVRTDEQKEFFSDMADLKRNEYERLSNYKTDGRIVSLEMINPPSAGLIGGGETVRSFDTIGEACRFAMEKSLSEYCLYLRLADLEEEMATKRLFLYLVRLLKNSLDHVQNRLELIESMKELKINGDAADICRDYPLEQIA
jgi:hypothetical protein